MTKKDYVKFAAMMKGLRELAQDHEHIDSDTLDIVQVELSRVLIDDNPQFDLKRFFAACKVDERSYW